MRIEGENVYLSVGEIMKLARRKAGLSVYQASEKAQVNIGTIYKIEQDKNVSTLGTFYKLCKAYNFRLDSVCKIGFDQIPVNIDDCQELEAKRG